MLVTSSIVESFWSSGSGTLEVVIVTNLAMKSMVRSTEGALCWMIIEYIMKSLKSFQKLCMSLWNKINAYSLVRQKTNLLTDKFLHAIYKFCLHLVMDFLELLKKFSMTLHATLALLENVPHCNHPACIDNSVKQVILKPKSK